MESTVNGINKRLAYKSKSYPEQYLVEVLSYNYDRVESNKKMYNGMELDIAIYDINTGIEYCGYYFHKDCEDRDKRKRDFIEKHGIRLIKIVEYSVGKVDDEKINILDNDNIEIYRVGRNKDLSELVEAISKVLNKQLDIPDDIYFKVKERVYTAYRNQNLAYQYPDIAKEYSSKNPIPVDKIFISDTSTVEWVCTTCNNSFNTSTHHRVYNKTKCPYCVGNLAVPGKNDIVTLLPGYAAEIISLSEYDKKNTLPYSSKIVTWRCTKCKHQWKSSINKRTLSKTGCAKCGHVPIEIDCGYTNVEYLNYILKPIESLIIDGKEIKVDLTDAIGIIIKYLVMSNTSSIDDILHTINSKDKVQRVSSRDNQFNIDRLVTTVNNTPIYIEGKSTTKYKVGILKDLIEAFNVDVKFKIKQQYELPKRITLSKNGVDYNVTIRLNGRIIYIGRRSSITEALKLRLSA